MKRLFCMFYSLLAIALISTTAMATDSFKIELNSYTNQVGEYLGITITAMNGGAPATDYFGTVTFTASTGAGTFTPVASGNFVSTPASQWSGGIQIIAAGDITLTVTGENGWTGNTKIALAPFPASQLIIFMPGQTLTPGLAPGATPDTVNLYEGVNYPITIYAVDQYYNIDTNFDGNMDLINPAGTVTPSGQQLATNGKAVFNAYFSATGLLTMQSNTPVAASEAVNIISTTEAWCHIRVPTQVTAGVPFSLTATVSTSQGDPDAVLPSNNDSFDILRFITGTSDSATGTWEPTDLFVVTSGRYSGYGFTYSRAESIYLRGEKRTGGSSVTIHGVESAPIEVLPNIPASMQITISPQQIQAQHEATIDVTVLDAYGNPTRSSLYDFSVDFAKISGGGYLSVTMVATNASGLASSVFTGGIVNETAQVQVTVRNNFDATIYAQETLDVKVSVAAAGKVVNYPNPFYPLQNQTTSINYKLDADSDVEIRIYDAFGRLVFGKNLKKDDTDAVSQSATTEGGASFEWDGKNGEGRVVANGIYFLKILANSGTSTQEFKRRVGVMK